MESMGNKNSSILDYVHEYVILAPIHVLQTLATTVCIVAAMIFFYYRASIRKQIEMVDQKMSRGLVYRDKTPNPKRKEVKCLELHPNFVQDHPDWQLCSMGEYLSTLRFFTDDDDGRQTTDNLPEKVKREVNVAIASALLQSFGPRMGAAMLPMLGINQVDSILGQIVSKFVSWVVANVFVDHGEEWDPVGDVAALPFSVSEIIGFVNLNQKLRKQSNMVFPPLEWMQRGEIGFDPTYHTPPPPAAAAAAKPGRTSNRDAQTNADGGQEDEPTSSGAHGKILVPNPFIIEEHFEAAILGLEDRIRAQESVTQTSAQALAEPVMTKDVYDPEDRSLARPQAINRTILPGLHVGWGDAKCTHTKREILRNRLFAVLLTKLSYNYHLRKEKANPNSCFVVQVKGRSCIAPDDFVQALLDAGHSIEVCPRSAITTFGLAACVKEEDDSWTNIPIAFYCRTGYERFDQRPSYFACPHGGIDMRIEGPLVGVDEKTGESRKCNIQFYMAIEGTKYDARVFPFSVRFENFWLQLPFVSWMCLTKQLYSHCVLFWISRFVCLV
jgi:hypothetical protein